MNLDKLIGHSDVIEALDTLHWAAMEFAEHVEVRLDDLHLRLMRDHDGCDRWFVKCTAEEA